jgi:hypothetical protein
MHMWASPTERSDMSQVFKCKRPGCPEKVTYERETYPGDVGIETKSSGKKIVYLTCERGDTFPYEVKTETEDDKAHAARTSPPKDR